MTDNPVFAELPGTEAVVLYDADKQALYIRLRPDVGGKLETHTLIANPEVNVDLYEGEAVGIEILLPEVETGE